VSWFLSIEAGEVADVSATVPRLTGHPARALEETVASG
jgi:hypothetical protein